MTNSNYVLQPCESRCKECDSKVGLLIERNGRPGTPVFFVCWHCHKVYQAGRGECMRDDASASSPTRVLFLTTDQAEKLEDVITSHQDEGPWGAGWASTALEALRRTVEEQLAEKGKEI